MDKKTGLVGRAGFNRPAIDRPDVAVSSQTYDLFSDRYKKAPAAVAAGALKEMSSHKGTILDKGQHQGT
ncbi:hypothetical protein GCM10007853_14900 [Algimonas ampicilliniresistens]|uniref:Uncharacterized protein n=1 Tax=Algimonas ampicilliniresistens TaxID=1298735 RepID=A0ABQ5VAL1_9PROT|nr:hypothetical protein GCM10007853_14900 [Algimonas ampicilliniresistens]